MTQRVSFFLALAAHQTTDDPARLHQKLSDVRGRLEVLNPIIAQLDADYRNTANQLGDGKVGQPQWLGN